MEHEGWNPNDFEPMTAWARGEAPTSGAAEETSIGLTPVSANVKYKPFERTANQYLFRDLCQRFELAYNIGERVKKYSTIMPSEMAKRLLGKSCFPIVRLVIPNVDTARGLFNIKHKSIASIYIDLLHLPKHHEDALRLKNWRNPTQGGSNATYGEFTDVLYDVLKSRVSNEWSNKTIGETNDLLDQLVQSDGKSRELLFRNHIFKEFSAVEQKWLVRIIIRDMKLGVKHEGLLRWLHRDAEQYFSSCCDLRRTCFALTNPTELQEMKSRLRVGQPFTPMLAQGYRGTGAGGQLEQCEAAMKKKKFVMDIKLDGERMLCHKNGDKVTWFTRRANEYSHIYGPVMNQLIIDSVFVEKCIIDGELVAYDTGQSFGDCGGLIPFGNNRTVAADEVVTRARGETPSKNLFFIVFDMLHASGVGASEILSRVPIYKKDTPSKDGDITHWPLDARRTVLKASFQEVPHRLELVKCEEVDEGSKEKRCAALGAFFNKAVESRQEGLVVKDMSSPYLVGEKSRAKSHWVKMKPEYSDQTTNLDVAVVGGYYGDGNRRSGLLSHFLLAVVDHTTMPADATEPSDVNKTKWFTMGKVGTGYSVQELQELNDKIKQHCKPYVRPMNGSNRKGSTWPQFLHPWNMKVDDVPDVFIPPNRSVVMEIKCSELVSTDQFSAGKTPRFPRCVNIRYDKGWYEAMTQKELVELRRETQAEDAGGGQARRLAKRKKTTRNVIAVVEGMGVVSKKDALGDLKKPISNIFEGYTFSVIPWGTEPKTIPGVKGLVLPWSKRNQFGGASASTQVTQSISQLTQGDLVGLEPEDAARIAAMREKRQKKLTVSDMQTLLYQHGAHQVVGAAMTQGVDFIVTIDPTSTRTQNLVNDLRKKQGETCDVVLAGWVYDSIVAEENLPLHFEYIVYACEDTKADMRHICDRYGDRFAEDCDKKSLIRTFNQVDAQHPYNPWLTYVQKSSKKHKRPRHWREQAAEMLLDEQVAMETPYTVFWRSTIIYVDCYETIGDIEINLEALPRQRLPFSPLSTSYHMLNLHSAQVSDHLHYNVTHVVVDPRDTTRFEQIKERIRSIQIHPKSKFSGVRVVTPDWVQACVEEGDMRAPKHPNESADLSVR